MRSQIDSIKLAQKIREHALVMTNRGNSSHIGSILSIADIVAVLYAKILTYDPGKPLWSGRDRFILSKGHAGAAVYAALAECGFFSVEELKTHYQNGSRFSGHVSHKGVPGVEFSTGSLGHGLPVAVGKAKALNSEKCLNDVRVFCLLSDGECDEGSNWEAILFAAHHNLNKLTFIVDYNKLQSLGSVASTIKLEPFAEKFRAFGCKVTEVEGHNHEDLEAALREVDSKRPHCIIAHTTKGKGVSFMENSVLWHYRSPQGEEYKSAMLEISNGEG